MKTPPALFYQGSVATATIFDPADWARLHELLAFTAPPQTSADFTADPGPWRAAEVLVAGWGSPPLTPEMEATLVNLKAIFHAGGSSKRLASPALLERGVLLSSTYAANAVPVAEFTLAHILLGLKSAWQQAVEMRANRFPRRLPMTGAYGAVVGLVSLGMIARKVIELLRGHAVRVIAYDPLCSPQAARELGVELVPLDQVFVQADVVSVHTPWLPETVGLVTGQHIAAMKAYSTFINTSRGAVVCQDELIAVLQQRPDLVAVLDVTYPEPPEASSPLYSLPNVILTPHIAGAMGNEPRRMGQYALAEVERYLRGEPLQWEIHASQLSQLA